MENQVVRLLQQEKIEMEEELVELKEIGRLMQKYIVRDLKP